MGQVTGIEWTDASWNPVRGCSRVSEGCRNCYAEKIAARFSDEDQPFHLFADRNKSGSKWTSKVELIEEALTIPLHWRKPRRIFVNSMSDLFHENLPDEAIDRVFAVMALCPQHTFQVLTKRPERMLQYFRDKGVEGGDPNNNLYGRWLDAVNMLRARVVRGYDIPISNPARFPLRHVWLGVSIEDQKTADERIPLLLQTPSAVRFMSYEPALGPVDLTRWLTSKGECIYVSGKPQRGIDWLICGGESGPSARPMHPDWARSVRDQCVAANVAFFFKQWGEWSPKSNFPNFAEWDKAAAHCLVLRDGSFTAVLGRDKPDDEFGLTCADLDGNDYAASMARMGKKKAGALLDGRKWREFPEKRS